MAHDSDVLRNLELKAASLVDSSTRTRRSIRLRIEPNAVLRLLLVVVAVITTIGTAANVVVYHVAPSPEHGLAKLMLRFDLSHDPSVPAFYSGLAMIVAAALAGIIAYDCRIKRSGLFWYWCVVSFVLVLLAIDEVVMVHEMVNTVMHGWLQTDGIFRFAWIIPYSLATLALGLFLLPLLWKLPSRTRMLLIIAGGVFVLGAVGMEMIAGLIAESLGSDALMLGSYAHTLAATVEEACEMLGMVICIYALLGHIADVIGSIHVDLSTTKRGDVPLGSLETPGDGSGADA